MHSLGSEYILPVLIPEKAEHVRKAKEAAEVPGESSQLTCDLGKTMVFPKHVLCFCKHVELFSVDHCEILMLLFFHKVGDFPAYIEVCLPVLGVLNKRGCVGCRPKSNV